MVLHTTISDQWFIHAYNYFMYRVFCITSYQIIPIMNIRVGGEMAGMINCMRFKPRDGQAEQMFHAMAEYLRDYPFDDILHAVIDLGNGEYALVGVHHSVDSFIEIMNRDNRISDLMREFVTPYDDGESFHSFSGPTVDLSTYL